MHLIFRFCLIILLAAVSFRTIGQPNNKEVIIKSLERGLGLYYQIESKDIKRVKASLSNSVNSDFLIDLLKEQHKLLDENNLIWDFYYNYQNDKIIFVIYSGSSIKDGSKWGLYNYLFITEIMMEYNNSNNSVKISKIRTLRGSQDLKDWWRHYMYTYNSEKHERKIWREKYDFPPPPPPPPPKSKDWF